MTSMYAARRIHIPPDCQQKLEEAGAWPTMNVGINEEGDFHINLMLGATHSKLFTGPGVRAWWLHDDLVAHDTPFGTYLQGVLTTPEQREKRQRQRVELNRQHLEYRRRVARGETGMALYRDIQPLGADGIPTEVFDPATDPLWVDPHLLQFIQLTGLQHNVHMTPGIAVTDLNEQVKRMTDLDTLGIAAGAEKPNFDEDQLAKEINRTMIKTPEGRYRLRLPFKPGIEWLPSNFGTAYGRAQGTHRRLTQDERKVYYGKFYEQIQEGILEPLPNPEPGQDYMQPHFLPHFPVITEKKIRPVVDASCKTKGSGLSLNALLEPGPQLLPLLPEVLMQFRIFPHVLTADIKAAFYQVEVEAACRNKQAILLPIDPTKDLTLDNVSRWRYTRLIMGSTSSPFLLLLAMHRLIQDHLASGQYHGLTREEVERLFKGAYVDNILIGYGSAKDGPRLVEGARAIFMDAMMPLREFASDQLEALAEVADKDKFPPGPVKFLGMEWDTEKNTIGVAPFKINDAQETRRGILSAFSRLYDPLGFVNPVILGARLLFRNEFDSHDPWDTPLKEEIREQWEAIKQDLQRLPLITQPRRLTTDRHRPVTLIILSDASPSAYGCIAYLHQELEDAPGEYTLDFVMARGRVAPTSKKLLMTVPRLELLACLLGSRLARFLLDGASGLLNIVGVHHWADSSTALHWLGEAPELRPYEARRVREIKANSPQGKFHYIPGPKNPADLTTKPRTTAQLAASNYFTGPDRLKTAPDKWPEWQAPPPDPTALNGVLPRVGTKEHKVDVIYTALAMAVQVAEGWSDHKPPIDVDLNRYWSMRPLARLTARVRRWMRPTRLTEEERRRVYQAIKAKKKLSQLPFVETPFDCLERYQATLLWVRFAQHQEYPALFKAQAVGPEVLRETPMGKRYQLIYDSELRVFRVGGRFAEMPMDQEAINPVLLPPRHQVTALIIMQAHLECLHSTAATTLGLVRSQWWLPQGLSAIRRATRNCDFCELARRRGPFARPPHAQLPATRLAPVRPFHHLLCDQLGPVAIFNRYKVSEKVWKTIEVKRWALIFSCTVTRAVHIEPLWDYSSAAVVRAFENFAARRGVPAGVIYLDQATAFQGTQRFIDRLFDTTVEFDVVSSLERLRREGRVQFVYSATQAPWSRGAVERMVGLVKRSLYPELWKRQLCDDKFRTLLTKIEALLNDRPLTAYSNDLNDWCPIRPSDLLFPSGRRTASQWPKQAVPEGEPPPVGPKASVQKRLRDEFVRREIMAEQWWRRFYKEYMAHLREVHLQENRRRKRGVETFQPKEGQVCLVVKNKGSRNVWPFARIQKLLVDPDGIARYAIVTEGWPSLETGRRSITELVPLELDAEMPEGAIPDVVKPKNAGPDPPRKKKKPSATAEEAAAETEEELEDVDPEDLLPIHHKNKLAEAERQVLEEDIKKGTATVMALAKRRQEKLRVQLEEQREKERLAERLRTQVEERRQRAERRAQRQGDGTPA